MDMFIVSTINKKTFELSAMTTLQESHAKKIFLSRIADVKEEKEEIAMHHHEIMEFCGNYEWENENFKIYLQPYHCTEFYLGKRS